MKLISVLAVTAFFVVFLVMSLFKVANGTDTEGSGIQKQLDEEQARIIGEMMKKKQKR